MPTKTDQKLEGDPLIHKLKDDKEHWHGDIPAPVSISSTRRSVFSIGRRWKLWGLVLVALCLWNTLLNTLNGIRHFCGTDQESLSFLDYALGHEQLEESQKEHPKFGFLTGKLAEKLFLLVPNNESAIAVSRQFATKPHMAGTPGDLDTALDFLKIVQREFGIPTPPRDPVYAAGTENSRQATLNITNLIEPKAWVDVYYPILNTPGNLSVEIIDDNGEVAWVADLEEKADEKDPDAHKYSNSVKTFHGLSAAGSVSGKLVYANYGRKEDYDALTEAGVELNGTIVIVRYGGIFRGLKVLGAQDRGAVGVLIYSDTRDDGSVTRENGYDKYPYGPARNPTSVQRGSVQLISLYPGDPTTPGYPSYKNSTRTEANNRPSIPSIPISAENAEALLKEIQSGGKNRVVKLVNEVKDNKFPIWNTMAVIPGHIKDEVVMIGNHRDAWVLGATDPSSGTVSAHEMIRGLGVLLKKGWRPLRTLLIASWDAEEYGLIGSTEWGEDFPEWIQQHVVAYVNLDSSVSGSRFTAKASPSLAHLVRSAAQSVAHPTVPGSTVWDARLDRGPLIGAIAPGVKEMHALQHGFSLDDEDAEMQTGTGVGPLGSGSDYTIFLQRLGVASTDFQFSSTLSDPVYHYHSVYDSQTWQETYADPGFHKHVAIAKLFGIQTLRLLDTIILPINTTQYALELEDYLNNVEDIAVAQELHTDFTSLRGSIYSLQSTSAALDVEKVHAEHELKEELGKFLWNSHKGWLKKKLRAIKRKIRKWIHRHKHPKHPKEPKEPEEPKPPKESGESCMSQESKEHLEVHQHHHHIQNNHEELAHDDSQGPPHHPHIPHIPHLPHIPHPHLPHHHHKKHRKHKKPSTGPSKGLIKAVKRVRAVNKKLIAFERGFISEDGLKGRTWYKHLGVAPGRWLGYGSTPLPGITEALTIEKNTTLAEYEADRLQVLIDKLVKELKV